MSGSISKRILCLYKINGFLRPTVKKEAFLVGDLVLSNFLSDTPYMCSFLGVFFIGFLVCWFCWLMGSLQRVSTSQQVSNSERGHFILDPEAKKQTGNSDIKMKVISLGSLVTPGHLKMCNVRILVGYPRHLKVFSEGPAWSDRLSKLKWLR